jgi:hypothetical protein
MKGREDRFPYHRDFGHRDIDVHRQAGHPVQERGWVVQCAAVAQQRAVHQFASAHAVGQPQRPA